MTFRRLIPLLVLSLLTITLTACGPEQVRKFARGIDGAESGLGAGIDTVRAFREAGEISTDKSLELAQAARDVNTLMGETVDFTLSQSAIDETGRVSLHSQYRDISERARRLVESGTIPIKNDRVKLAFTLGAIAGQAALDVAVDDLGAKLPDGVTIPIDAETRTTLEGAREKIRRNDERLKEAIENLEKLLREGNFGRAGSSGGGAATDFSTLIGMELKSGTTTGHVLTLSPISGSAHPDDPFEAFPAANGEANRHPSAASFARLRRGQRLATIAKQ